jgi:hypothetical protein
MASLRASGVRGIALPPTLCVSRLREPDHSPLALTSSVAGWGSTGFSSSRRRSPTPPKRCGRRPNGHPPSQSHSCHAPVRHDGTGGPGRL